MAVIGLQQCKQALLSQMGWEVIWFKGDWGIQYNFILLSFKVVGLKCNVISPDHEPWDARIIKFNLVWMWEWTNSAQLG